MWPSAFAGDAPGMSGIRAFGFQIDWLSNPKSRADFEDGILKALQVWSERPAVLSSGQHEFARQHFNAPIQFGKVVRAYEWLEKKA